MDKLITIYQKRLPLQNATFVCIDHSDTIVAIVYKVTLPNGTHLILKICPRNQDFFRESYFLKRFSESLPVPKVFDLVAPEPKVYGAILMQFLPGSLLKKTDLTDDLAFQIGSVLARIHLNSEAGYGDLTQPQDLSPDPKVHFTMKFEEGFSECKDHLPNSLLNKIRHYYEAHHTLFELADGPCVIHRDFRPGNIIIHNGQLSGIIDWASGRASFAQEDFCPLEHGEWSLTPNHLKYFLAGYRSIRRVPAYQDMTQFLRLNRALAAVGFTVKQGTWKTTDAHFYQRNRDFLEKFRVN